MYLANFSVKIVQKKRVHINIPMGLRDVQFNGCALVAKVGSDGHVKAAAQLPILLGDHALGVVMVLLLDVGLSLKESLLLLVMEEGEGSLGVGHEQVHGIQPGILRCSHVGVVQVVVRPHAHVHVKGVGLPLIEVVPGPNARLSHFA
jgi:hypothetical protein